MSLPRSRPVRFVIALFGTILLAACGAGPSSDPDTVTMAIDTGPTTLDPRVGTDAASERLTQLMFSSLVKKNEQSGLEPDLATSWETPDATTYIFHLRNDVTFHDGRPLTSADVVYTFRSVLDGSLSTPKTGIYEQMIAKVEAVDATTVVFTLKEPFGPFLWNLARGAIGVVPEGAGQDFRIRPIGSGPFRFVRYAQDEEVVLERNDHYYDRKPYIRTARFKIIPEAIVSALELRKGSVDIAENVLPPDMIEALREDSRLHIVESPGTNYQYIAFNLRDPLFRDLRVRQAFAYAIDREAIVKYLWRGQARLASGVIPPNNWAYAPDVTTYPYDPERARALLAESGHADLSFTYRTSTDDAGRLLAAALEQQFREVGVRMNIRSNEFATFFQDVRQGNFQMYSLRWVGGNNDPDIFNYIFHSKMTPPNGANRGFFENAEVDRLIEIARRYTDTARRRDAYAEIQRIVARNLPYVSLWYTNNVCVYNQRITGLKLYPAGDYDFLLDIRLDRDAAGRAKVHAN
ncbi:MAG TPA: ABC transporter substrate-binding protein [Terriglobia bacterium]|nr:ABC transporter substrate-binding protein [Terriglobia bacterium]